MLARLVSLCAMSCAVACAPLTFGGLSGRCQEDYDACMNRCAPGPKDPAWSTGYMQCSEGCKSEANACSQPAPPPKQGQTDVLPASGDAGR